MSEGTGAVLAETFAALRPHLNERQRRLALGAAARALGRGGIRWVAGMTGAAESTVSRGVRELESGAAPSARVRTGGGGRGRRGGGGTGGGRDTVAALLKKEGFSLQATSRTSEGARHPDRDGQFHYINDRVEEFTA